MEQQEIRVDAPQELGKNASGGRRTALSPCVAWLSAWPRLVAHGSPRPGAADFWSADFEVTLEAAAGRDAGAAPGGPCPSLRYRSSSEVAGRIRVVFSSMNF